MIDKLNPRIEALFRNSESLLGEGLKKLGAGDVRRAVELATEATLTAAYAFVIAKTGEENEEQVADCLRELRRSDPQINIKVVDHYVRVNAAMYLLLTSKVESWQDYIEIVYQTADFIKDARELAGSYLGDNREK
jgi:anthranilate phosphoribosyltransferase